MRASTCLLLLLAAAATAAVASCKPAEPRGAQRGGDDSPFVLSELRPGGGSLATLLAAEADKAHARGLKPFLEVSATWCGPCQKLKQSLHDPLMTDAFRGTYIVTVDLDAWDAQLRQTGYAVQAVPVFFKIGDGGRPAGPKLDGGAWSQDVPAEMAPPLKRFFNS
jgi:Thioredoxin